MSVGVRDVEGHAAACPFGCYHRRQLLDPRTRGVLCPSLRSVNRIISHRERPPRILPFLKFEIRLSATKDLTDASYDGEWVTVEVTSENLSPELGGPEGFDKWYVA